MYINYSEDYKLRDRAILIIRIEEKKESVFIKTCYPENMSIRLSARTSTSAERILSNFRVSSWTSGIVVPTELNFISFCRFVISRAIVESTLYNFWFINCQIASPILKTLVCECSDGIPRLFQADDKTPFFRNSSVSGTEENF